MKMKINPHSVLHSFAYDTSGQGFEYYPKVWNGLMLGFGENSRCEFFSSGPSPVRWSVHDGNLRKRGGEVEACRLGCICGCWTSAVIRCDHGKSSWLFSF